MQPLRGFLMLVAAGVAFYRGWKIWPGHNAWLAFGLGVLAIAMAVWHLTRPAQNVSFTTANKKRT